MAVKKRAKKTSSGVGKNRAGKNVSRRTRVPADPVVDQFIRHQAANRWPSQATEAMYFELNNDKTKKDPRPAKRIKPPRFEFALMESIKPEILDKLLTAASMKIKRVKRYPGWILQQTYNLKNRPLQFI